MSWRPNAGPEIARARSRMLEAARRFFATRSLLEIETPALSSQATMDANIASVEAKLSGTRGYLVTSPEYHMKRLLAAGYPDIYQICRVFRDSEFGRHHLPEFTLVEWYRLNFGLRAMIDESTEFILNLLGNNSHMQQGKTISYKKAFESALNLNPFEASVETISRKVNADVQLIATLGNDRDTWLDLAMAQQVAKSFPTDRLTVVEHYPITQASLARPCPSDDQLADRFEIYFGPLELANGFVELTDTDVQRNRFKADQRKRKEKKLPIHCIDENLLDALSFGLPACAGVAVGLDRILMIREQANQISDVVLFSPGT